MPSIYRTEVPLHAISSYDRAEKKYLRKADRIAGDGDGRISLEEFDRFRSARGSFPLRPRETAGLRREIEALAPSYNYSYALRSPNHHRNRSDDSGAGLGVALGILGAAAILGAIASDRDERHSDRHHGHRRHHGNHRNHGSNRHHGRRHNR